LGNPPNNQSKSVISLGSWASQIPTQSVIFDRNEIVVGYAIVPYSGHSYNTDTQVLSVWTQVCSLSVTKTIAFAFSSSLFYEWLI